MSTQVHYNRTSLHHYTIVLGRCYVCYIFKHPALEFLLHPGLMTRSHLEDLDSLHKSFLLIFSFVLDLFLICLCLPSFHAPSFLSLLYRLLDILCYIVIPPDENVHLLVDLLRPMILLHDEIRKLVLYTISLIILYAAPFTVYF